MSCWLVTLKKCRHTGRSVYTARLRVCRVALHVGGAVKFRFIAAGSAPAGGARASRAELRPAPRAGAWANDRGRDVTSAPERIIKCRATRLSPSFGSAVFETLGLFLPSAYRTRTRGWVSPPLRPCRLPALWGRGRDCRATTLYRYAKTTYATTAFSAQSSLRYTFYPERPPLVSLPRHDILQHSGVHFIIAPPSRRSDTRPS